LWSGSLVPAAEKCSLPSVGGNGSSISDVADFLHQSRYEAPQLIKDKMFNRSTSAAILLIPCWRLPFTNQNKMLHKEIEKNNRKVQIYRQKSRIQNGYEYFLQVLTKGIFGDWVVNTNYKQKTEINSEKVAFRMANEFLDDVI
jgi:hypothetical protein